MTLLRYRNFAVGAALVLAGGATLLATSSFAWGRAPAVDPALFPRIIALLLITVGIVIVVLGATQARRGTELPSEGGEGVPVDIEIPAELLADREPEGTDAKSGILLAVLVTVYAIGAFQLGFATSTFLFLIVGSLVLGHRRGLRGLVSVGIVAVAITIAYYVGFFVLLGVREPTTLLL